MSSYTFAFVALLALATLCGCGPAEKVPPANPPAQPASPMPMPAAPPAAPMPTAPAEEKVDFQVTADQLAAERTANATALQSKYAGKTLDVTGTVQFIGARRIEPFGVTLVLVQEGPLPRVIVTSKGFDLLNEVAPGQTVVVRAQVDEADPSVELQPAKVMQVSGEACPTLTTKELVEKVAPNTSEFHTTWKDKQFYLTGVVAKLEKEGDKRFLVAEEGAVKIRLLIEMAGYEAQLDAMKPGDAFRALVLVSVFSEFTAETYTLTNNLIVPAK